MSVAASLRLETVCIDCADAQSNAIADRFERNDTWPRTCDEVTIFGLCPLVSTLRGRC
jgi:hypothetical protein